MEKIGDTLKSLTSNAPQGILSPKNYSSPDEESEETELQKAGRLLRSFNISSLNHTFDRFSVTPDTKQAYEILKDIASGKSDRKLVLLYGVTGSGKTHLVEATILAMAERKMFARYYTFSEIARSLKVGLSEGNYSELFKAYCEAKILIVDDIGSGTTESRFEISDLEDIVDFRYRRRFYPDVHYITILATNKDIKKLSERIVSRCYDPEVGVVICTGDKDYRRRK